ncbi:MAG: ATP-binding protein [Candidatus Fermentibacteraceae bacterium]
MKELTVVSGKGGTGKTSLAASISVLAPDSVLADCDVDAADLYLVFDPRRLDSEEFSGGSKAAVIPDLCTGCGRCVEVCRFDAFTRQGSEPPVVDQTFCEGCGVCRLACPADAIDFSPSLDGWVYRSATRRGPMVHAELALGRENSGKLVSLVRKRAAQWAGRKELDLVVIDGSPGIGCPVIASLTGVDLALMLAEPSVSGVHDLQRLLSLSSRLGVESAVAVNRWDISPEMTGRIEDMARETGAEFLGRIRYDDRVTEAIVARKAPVEHFGEGAAEDMRQVWRRAESLLRRQG